MEYHTMTVFQAEHITSTYGRKRILSDVSISGEQGQCVGIVGANGSGKTTLLDIMAGMRRPQSGTLTYLGKTIIGRKQQSLFAKYTGYVPQENMLIPEVKVWDNLLLWYQDKDVLRTELKEGVLALLGLQEMLSTPVRHLSGGMAKRVSIGCAMAGNPPVLIMDEPGAALDMPGKNDVISYLEEYKKQGGTILLATHEEQELNLCDKLYVLKQGQCTEVDINLKGKLLVSLF